MHGITRPRSRHRRLEVVVKYLQVIISHPPSFWMSKWQLGQGFEVLPTSSRLAASSLARWRSAWPVCSGTDCPCGPSPACLPVESSSSNCRQVSPGCHGSLCATHVCRRQWWHVMIGSPDPAGCDWPEPQPWAHQTKLGSCSSSLLSTIFSYRSNVAVSASSFTAKWSSSAGHCGQAMRVPRTSRLRRIQCLTHAMHTSGVWAPPQRGVVVLYSVLDFSSRQMRHCLGRCVLDEPAPIFLYSLSIDENPLINLRCPGPRRWVVVIAEDNKHRSNNCTFGSSGRDLMMAQDLFPGDTLRHYGRHSWHFGFLQ